MTKSHPIFLLFILAFLFTGSGCAKIAHMQELLTIKGYSEEKDRQGLIVQEQNKDFERLLDAAKHGDLERYPDQRSIWKNFGAPVYQTRVSLDQSTYQAWIYRYSTKFFGSDKVYLYFDSKGKLKIYDYTPGGTLTPFNKVEHDAKSKHDLST